MVDYGAWGTDVMVWSAVDGAALSRTIDLSTIRWSEPSVAWSATRVSLFRCVGNGALSWRSCY